MGIISLENRSFKFLKKKLMDDCSNSFCLWTSVWRLTMVCLAENVVYHAVKALQVIFVPFILLEENTERCCLLFFVT